MKRILIICLFFIYSSVNAQVSSSEGRGSKANIKTNALNLIMIPSIHFEYRIARSSSLQFNFHRGHITFISEHDWLNASLDFRKYFPGQRIDAMTGWYISAGFAYKYDYNDVILDDLDNIVKNGLSRIGPIVRCGYQFGLSDAFTMDLGIGLAALLETHSYKRNPGEGEYRAMCGIGYRFR
jgi:hypothetical protein